MGNWHVGTWQLFCGQYARLVNEILPYRSHAHHQSEDMRRWRQDLYKRKSWGKGALLAPVFVSEFDATVADL
jgi:hypothetical protein